MTKKAPLFFRSLAGALLASTSLLVLPTFARASSLESAAAPQEPADAPQTSASSENRNAGDIIVTAQRRDERQVSVPASVAVVTAETLQTSGVAKFQDLGNVVPGVQISRSGSYTQPAIRGITTTFAGNGQETNVGVYIDGFYQSDQLSINQDFANLANVQVLKGPQSVLYGRNATGGAILITTKSPNLNATEMDASVSYARYKDIISRGYVSVPLIDDLLAVSAAGYYRRNDGYITDINGYAPGITLRHPEQGAAGRKPPGRFENESIRLKLLLTPSENFSLTFGYNYTRVDDPRAFDYQFIGQSPFAASVPAPYRQATQRDRVSLNYAPQSLTKRDEYTLLAELQPTDKVTVTSRSAYGTQSDDQLYDFDGTPVQAFDGAQINDRKTFTQSLDVAIDLGDRLNILGGAFYYNDKYQTTFGLAEFVGANGYTRTTNYVKFDTESYSVYLDGTLRLGDAIFLTVGGRYNWDEKYLYRDDFSSLNGGPTSTLSGSNSASFKAFTPRASLRYEFDPNTNLYATVSRGFKSGTINSTRPLNILDPEEVTGYEIGFKTRRGGFYVELASYYYDYSNNQVSALDANTPGITTLIQNSGGSKIYGADASATWRVSDRFNLRAGLAYVHARYTDFSNATNVTLNASGTANTTVLSDWTGRRIARAPDWSGSFGGDYRIDLGDGGSVTTSGTLSFSSRYAPQNSSYNCAIVVVAGVSRCNPAIDYSGAAGRLEENGWVTVNGQIQWKDRDDHFSVAVFAENLFNQRYKIISTATAYGTSEIYNQPRSIGARLGFRF